jgi:hypothetical protein
MMARPGSNSAAPNAAPSLLARAVHLSTALCRHIDSKTSNGARPIASGHAGLDWFVTEVQRR